ncbi:MAG TPA: EF-hand domain-containing protein [Sphingomonadaceae bacterium]|nr:EF-hand domain-containing protein [Sphingomonadaceae bacterium]
MIKNLSAAVAAGLLAASGVALAATFTEIDANGDGAVSKEEFMAAYPDVSDDVWNAVDVNGDDSVSEDELQAAADSGVLPAG